MRRHVDARMRIEGGLVSLHAPGDSVREEVAAMGSALFTTKAVYETQHR